MPRPAGPWVEWAAAALLLLACAVSGGAVLAYPAWHGVLLARANEAALLLLAGRPGPRGALRFPSTGSRLVALITAVVFDAC